MTTGQIIVHSTTKWRHFSKKSCCSSLISLVTMLHTQEKPASSIYTADNQGSLQVQLTSRPWLDLTRGRAWVSLQCRLAIREGTLVLSHRHMWLGGQLLSSPPLSPQCCHRVPIRCWVYSERAISQGLESDSNHRPSARDACAIIWSDYSHLLQCSRPSADTFVTFSWLQYQTFPSTS